jgi:hypothetical protein
MTIHRSATGVAVVVALAAGASTASARTFDIDANGSFVPRPHRRSGRGRRDQGDPTGERSARRRARDRRQRRV